MKRLIYLVLALSLSTVTDGLCVSINNATITNITLRAADGIITFDYTYSGAQPSIISPSCAITTSGINTLAIKAETTALGQLTLSVLQTSQATNTPVNLIGGGQCTRLAGVEDLVLVAM